MKNKRKFSTLDIVFIGMFAALMAVCSWISIPLSVPITLQTFGVFLAVGLLGGRDGTLSVVIFILLGAVGVPVFSGFTGGLSVIAGPTGGYIVGFIFSALVMWLFEVIFKRKAWAQIVSMVLGLFVCYALGTIWFMVVYTKSTGSISLYTTLSLCVIPFIIPDIVKIVVAFGLSNRLYKYVPIHNEISAAKKSE